MTEAEWHKLLDRSPGDAELRRAFATWLQDEADDAARAEFQFWLVEEGKWPTPNPLNREEKGWAWYYQMEVTEPAKHATLTSWALHHMPKRRWLYATRHEAEEALFPRLAKVVSDPEEDAGATRHAKEGKKEHPAR